MNVKELREALADLPDDLTVVVRGYEAGVNEVSTLSRYDVKRDSYDRWYYGQHEPIEDGYPEASDEERMPVVELEGDNALAK